MAEIMMRLYSGREFRFSCEHYKIEINKLNGGLIDFSYRGGVGECPLYFRMQDVEAIAIVTEGGSTK